MKTHIKSLFTLPALIVNLALIPAGPVTAQTFTTLHSFPAYSDGANPSAGLILSGGTLYGTAKQSAGDGTVFAINTDGTGFTNLHNFSYSDGANPQGDLVLSGNTLYGTMSRGGSGTGTVFAINTNGTGFTNLYSFTPSCDRCANSDGAVPAGDLVLLGNTLYGTAARGGSSIAGTVFAINTDGTGFTNLHNFSYSDGANPYAGLVLSGNTLYGIAAGGGSGSGTVFAINTDGTGFTNVYSFTALSNAYPIYTNSDGAVPAGDLVLLGNTLYGTAGRGGSSGAGTVFALTTDGTGFTNLHNFSYSDGANPYAGLVLSGNTLYGTAPGGGSGSGTVFAINTDGTGFTNLYSFTVAVSTNILGLYTNSDGAVPSCRLILSGNTLFGTAQYGGSFGSGTVFSLSFRPQLTITTSGTNVILSWPTGVAGFSYTGYNLQETANLDSPDAWVLSSFFPPVISNGQIKLTGPMLGPQRYYRLAR